MKLCAFHADGALHLGVLTGGGVVDITLLGFTGDMNTLIAGGDALLREVDAAIADYSGGFLPESGLDYANVTRPGKIICEGLNYREHAEETGGEPPKYPILFGKYADALSPAGKSVTLPRWLRCFDYEAELVIVVGREAYNVSEEEAADCIFGYTSGNDLSARDSQFLSTQWLPGKAFPGFAPAGPFIVTGDSFDPYADNRISCEVNGVTVQSAVTSSLIFGCRETLSAASKYLRLAPGDLIFTGTPPGVVLGKPKGTRVWLKPGDTVKVTIEGIGALLTPLA